MSDRSIKGCAWCSSQAGLSRFNLRARLLSYLRDRATLSRRCTHVGKLVQRVQWVFVVFGTQEAAAARSLRAHGAICSRPSHARLACEGRTEEPNWWNCRPLAWCSRGLLLQVRLHASTFRSAVLHDVIVPQELTYKDARLVTSRCNGDELWRCEYSRTHPR